MPRKIFLALLNSMKSKFLKLLILVLFLAAFVGSAVWMFNKYVVPNSPYNKDIKLRGMD